MTKHSRITKELTELHNNLKDHIRHRELGPEAQIGIIELIVKYSVELVGFALLSLFLAFFIKGLLFLLFCYVAMFCLLFFFLFLFSSLL